MAEPVDELSTFHEVGRLFPGETEVHSIAPQTSVVDALQIMVEHRYSQLPVVQDGRTRGVFSLWSLARQIASTPGLDLASVDVEDLMDPPIPKVTVEDSLHEVLDQLDRYEALLVESPKGLQAIATHADVLRYFYEVARPFVLVQEIELSLRMLIGTCAPSEQLSKCIDNAIRGRYEKHLKQPVPADLQDMTFEDYRSIITSSKNWKLFEGILGRNRDLVSSRLERIRDLRNAIFHFRSDLSVLDYQTLVANRDWLLRKLRRAEAQREVDNG